MNKKELIKIIFYSGGISGWLLIIYMFGYVLFINLIFFLVSVILPLIYIIFKIIEKIIIFRENKIKKRLIKNN